MRISYWPESVAFNGAEAYSAFLDSLRNAGHELVKEDLNADAAVIWSVLWHGRLAANKSVWDAYRSSNRNVIVLEVGCISRGTTWKVGLNGINRTAYFGEQDNDGSRSTSLGLVCEPWRSDSDFILVCGQHDKSLQWQGMPSMSNWFLQTYDEIRKHSERPIIFRPHPRCRLEHIERGLKHVTRQEPKYVNGTYDDFDMGFANIHCTISYSSNPGIHSIVNGVPAFVSNHSLAYPVGNNIDFLHNIENPMMPDRTQWLNDLSYTEWTVDEIAAGIPLSKIYGKLSSAIS